MRLLKQAAMFAALIFLVPLAAYAQEATLADSTAVLVPYGSWLDAILANAQGIAVAAILSIVAVASRNAPAWLAQIIKMLLTEQMLAHAVAFGINAVRGAVKGQTLSVGVGSEVLAQAFTYVISKAPGWFLKWVGGPENLKTMILARLDLEADADAKTVLEGVLVDVRPDGTVKGAVVPGTVMANGDVLVGRAAN